MIKETTVQSLLTKQMENIQLTLSSRLESYDKAPKFYWFIRSRYLNSKKVPTIPPIPSDDQRVSDL